MLKSITTFLYAVLIYAMFTGNFASAQQATKLTLRLDQSVTALSPVLYGLMTEEINYSYDGGIYAELIRNRIFKDNYKNPDHWSLVKNVTDSSAIVLDNKHPVNEALTECLRFNLATEGKNTGLANDGFWGIPVFPATNYRGSFYAMTDGNNPGPITVSIESTDGKTTFATANIAGVSGNWKKFTFNLTSTASVTSTADTRFVIRPSVKGSYWFTLVSLFPPTYLNTPNGNRRDIMQLLASMSPKFLRLPGGNYLEGNMFSTRYNWKNTLGPIDNRPGHQGTWGYRSSDGMGLLEYLKWCEDLKMEPLLAVFAGYTLNRDFVEAGPFLKPYVDDALEEIEYVTGDTTTRYGKLRARDGHPAPFPLHYVEIGNEDGFDMSGSYDGRFAQFYDAIRSKYPTLQIISTTGGKDFLGQRFPLTKRVPDIIDEHYYRNAFEMESDAYHYDNYDRNGPKIFVGEWATREGKPTPNFNSALGDAAWMTGMERNSDIVVMSCSAPLFVNVNPGGMQWESDLIGYNTLTSYGSPSYYAQQMFSNYHGDKVVNMIGEGIPVQVQKLNHKDSLNKVTPKTYPSLFYVTTRDSKTGRLYVKVVNAGDAAKDVTLDIQGVPSVKSSGKIVVMKADKPEDTNTITEPDKIKPIVLSYKTFKKNFSYNFPKYSITLLQIDTQ
ncbi:alpha-L-arabinofuranosidase C-terminal domain-containing protein [Mucilaginibacter sp. BT774]|uniref:alpha-L-arabinofuranosidase C-terminal domain-containing protein n=1 Tax=Mucilaginibacter sp. BT774 TaxID=3062276 RepID=UPI002674CEAC|nr:alpha-L-arabinofuranosidase C-terminal domain-containing protein [Mucilaginibacter sp. BT774]MDO3628017.1 alpha-L-arabinofuranosidase C-terminal domain-containing protein [Mucilaginibacter sp. BT774]